jgi:hypothetical protein
MMGESSHCLPSKSEEGFHGAHGEHGVGREGGGLLVTSRCCAQRLAHLQMMFSDLTIVLPDAKRPS